MQGVRSAACRAHSLLGAPAPGWLGSDLITQGSDLTPPAPCRRRRSLLGVRFWASQRALEGAMRRAAGPLLGTWAMRAYLRALGARLGAWATIRMTNLQLVPDMLDIGEGAHVGDAANLCASYALDAETVVVGRIEMGAQARLPGACSGAPGSHCAESGSHCAETGWPPAPCRGTEMNNRHGGATATQRSMPPARLVTTWGRMQAAPC
jgi:hypothetical protein